MSKPISSDSQKPKCAQCRKKPVVAEYRPFCSKRCADVDLNQWLSDGYAIPGAPADPAQLPGGGQDGEEMADDD